MFYYLCIYILVLVNSLSYVVPCNALQPLITKQLTATDTQVHPVARWEKRVQTLKMQREQVQAKVQEVRALNEQLSESMHLLKRKINEQDVAEQRFLNQKLALMGQQNTVLIEWEESSQRTIRSLDTTIMTLQEQESACNAGNPQTIEISPAEKAVTGYEDLIAAEQKVLEVQAQLTEAENNRVVIAEDINQRKRAFDFAQDEYDQKHADREQFSSGSVKRELFAGFTPVQQGELIDLEERLAWYKRQLAQAKVQEAECAFEESESRIDRLKTQISDFKKSFNRIKKTVNITEEYAASRERNLDQLRQNAIAEREANNDKLRDIAADEIKVQKGIKEIQQQFDISPADLATIRSLNKDPKTMNDWIAYARLLGLFIVESLHHIRHEDVAAQLELDKAKFRRDELEVLIMRSWRRMTIREMQFKSDDEVEQEIKQYHVAKAELESQLAAVTRARDAAINSLHEFNVSFEKLRGLASDLVSSQRTIFKDYPKNYYELIKLFESIEENVRLRFDLVSSLIEKYSTALTTIQGSIKRTEAVIKELIAKSFWRRSETSLSWSDFYTFIPDMLRFWDNFKQHTSQFLKTIFSDSVSIIQNFVGGLFSEPLRLILLLVNIVLIITSYYLIKFYLPDIAHYLSSVGQGYWIIHHACSMVAAFLLFVMRHLLTVYGWVVIFVLLNMVSNPTIFLIYLKQLFYLVTIPYALWFIMQMVQAWRETNREKRYVFVSEHAESRFFAIIAFMLSSLTILFCIREAFMLGGYPNSRVPIVLGAILYLVGQVSLIALLSRSQILGLIRSDTPLWEWVYDHVNRYYYVVWLVVTATIVMFNPYIGYGKQVFYIIVRLLFTAALLSFFSWIHGNLKRASVDLFFYYSDRDVLKDRFPTARFWYGMFIVSALALFLGAGIYFGARVWGMPLTLREMTEWLTYPFYTPIDEAGREVKVSLLSIIYIGLYVVAGFVVAYLVNRFIISRVLDPIIVESGVQNTVLTLTRYIIITITLFIGFSSEGLGGLTTKLAILLTGLGFALQDTIRDVASYFIILVQRPIKVGDFIRVMDNLADNENVSLMGFVRSITPRSIVIRKRNSTTMIVPNSRIVQNPIMNWSYTRGFFAFDDIRITVPYSADPVIIRQLMFDVLDKNPNILKNPSPIVRLDDFVDNGYLFLIRAFLTSNKIGEQWDIAAELRLNMVKALRDNNIEIASPIRTLRLTSSDNNSLFPPVAPSR